MSVPESLASLVGQWRGKNRLWLMPEEPAQESTTTLDVSLAALGQFVTLQYTWAYEGAPQEGVLIMGQTAVNHAVRAVWIDSWHMQDQFMVCQGSVGKTGDVSVKGAYAAPPGPDWGWQIEIFRKDDNLFELIMHNITPDGEAALAVAATYTRMASS